MMLFETVEEHFKSKGCVLLTTKAEYEAMQKMPKVKFIASCGHENEVFINVFIYRNTGVVCKNCVGKRVTILQKERKPDNHVQEHMGFCVLQEIIGEFFEMQKTHEGCLADCGIRPKTSTSDEWLAIQLKVSNQVSFNMCSFHITNKYTNCLIVCIQLQLRKFWVIDGNIELPKKLNITQKYSKYDKYLVKEDKLVEQLTMLYSMHYKHTFNDVNVPLSEQARKEIEFRELRETNIPITFIYPEVQNRVYDFMIEDLKVQEKVGHRVKGKQGISFSLHKRNGKKELQSYVKGDNDFYWLHCPDKQTFYVIPEYVLIEKDCISLETNSKKKSLYICPGIEQRKNAWTEQYKFEYATFQLSELLEFLRVSRE